MNFMISVGSMLSFGVRIFHVVRIAWMVLYRELCHRLVQFLVVIGFVGGACVSVTGQISVQKIGIADGLPLSSVYALDGDSLGNLWLGTLGGGVASFDGTQFKRVDVAAGLASDMIMDVRVGNRGLWIATQKGISYFDGRAIRNFPATESFYPLKIFFSGDTTFFTTVEGWLGAVVNDSLHVRVVSQRWQGVSNVLRCSARTLLMNQPARKRFILANGRSSSVIHYNSTIQKIHAVVTSDERPFLSTNQGVFQIEGDSLRQALAVDFPIYFYDSLEKVFYGKREGKLVQVGWQGAIQVLKEFTGLIGCSYKDKDGSNWIGTNIGLFKVTLPAFTRVDHLPDEEVPLSLHATNREIWVGTASLGASVVDSTGRSRIIDLGGGKKNFVASIKADSSGVLYFGTGGGLMTYRKGGVAWKNKEIVESAAFMDFDRKGRLLVASTVQGAYLINNEVATRVQGLESDIIQCINYSESLDAFAIGTNAGLKLWKDGNVSTVQVQAFKDLQLSVVRWINADLLAVGTYGYGVFIYSFKQRKVVLKVDLTMGLSSNTIFIVYPSGNKLWIGTQAGIDRLTVSPEYERLEAIDHFGEADGLAGLETNQDAVTETVRGIHFGLVSGVYRFRGITYRSPHPLHISEVKLFFNRMVGQGDSTNRLSSPDTFRHDENHLTFTFQKINKRDPGATFYRYKLEGFDQVWSNPTASTSVTYSNLPPGDFDFTVLATDKSGYFTFEEVHYRFVIQPNFYQTGWFLFLVSASLVGLLVVASHLYNRRRLARAIYIQELKDAEKVKLRKEIARDFHDELGNQLARMINFMSILRIRNELQKDVYETLSEYSQTILNGTKDFVWALDPANDDLGNVLIHLKDFAERMFFEKSIEFRFQGDAAISIKLKLGFSRQINLIFKEAMTNVFRHSGATRVELGVQVLNDLITIHLRDNGAGITTDQAEKSSRGLQNMRVRANRIGAELRIQSASPGTVIELSFAR